MYFSTGIIDIKLKYLCTEKMKMSIKESHGSYKVMMVGCSMLMRQSEFTGFFTYLFSE